MMMCGFELKPSTSLETPATQALTLQAGITTSMWGSNAATDETSFLISFHAILPRVIENAMDMGLLVGRLGLTDPKGNPLCAAVRPPAIEWSAATPGFDAYACPRSDVDHRRRFGWW